MGNNFAYRSTLLIASVLLAFLSLSPLAVAAEADATRRNHTPQALLATYHSALARKDWQTCYWCYDARMRADDLSKLAYAIAVLRDAKLSQIVKKHQGHTSTTAEEPAIPQVRSDTLLAKELRMYAALQKQIRDLPAFVAEISDRLDALGQRPFLELADVKDITIQGDAAVGYWNLPIQLEGQAPANNWQPVYFRKLNGGWYLTIPDPPLPLSVSERAAKLQAEVETFYFVLCCNNQAPGEKKEYGELRMSIRPFVYKSPTPAIHLVRLSPAQAKKLIEYLATEGFLHQAVEAGKQEVPDRVPSEFWYTLQVSTEGILLHEDLGWGPGLLKRLAGLREALAADSSDGEASRAMDAILSELSD